MTSTVWQGRLPNGSFTTDKKKHMEEWTTIARPFCEHFKAKLVSYDPELTFRLGEDTGSSVSRTVTLDLQVINVLNDVLLKGKKNDGDPIQA
jgi:hypothetical protein